MHPVASEFKREKLKSIAVCNFVFRTKTDSTQFIVVRTG